MAVIVDVHQLKRLLLAEEFYVRECAARYLEDGGLGDEEAMALVLEACEKHGAKHCLSLLSSAKQFPLPHDCVDRLLALCGKCQDLNVGWNLLGLVPHLPLDRLPEAANRLRGMSGVAQAITDTIEFRREFEKQAPEELLADFMEWLGTQWGEQIEGRDELRCEEYIHAIVRGGESVKPAVAETFARLQDDDGWPPVFLCELAGALRVRETVSRMVEYLLAGEKTGDYLFESATNALARIGDPQAVHLIEPRFPEQDFPFQIYASSVLGRLKHPDSVRAILSLRDQVEDDEAYSHLFQACCEQMVPEALDWARQIYADFCAGDEAYMRRHLITTARLHGLDLPEREAWHEEILAEKRRLDEAMRGGLFGEWFKNPFKEWDAVDPRPTPPATGGGAEDACATDRPAQQRRKVGRNEPCPCGSGKKYKKCCLGKE